MRYSLVFWAAPALLTQTLAWTSTKCGNGNSIIVNKCGDVAYFWEDDGNGGAEMQSIQPGDSYTKYLYQTGKAGGAGPSFKITVAGPNGAMPVFDSSPITQFEYTCNAPNWPGFTSFDISNVNGGGAPPFVKGGVSVSSPQDHAALKTCAAGQNPCTQGYTAWNDDKWAMVQTAMNNDIVMTLCGPKPGTVCGGGGPSSGGSPHHHHHDSPPPPQPQQPKQEAPPSSPPATSTSAAPPVVPEVQKNDEEEEVVVYVTETAAAVVETVWARLKDRSPEPEEKRAEHIHQHAHAHNKFNKRRHGA